MADRIESIHGAIVQHGRLNDRIYLMHLQGTDHHVLIATLDRMAAKHGYGKIFAKIPATAWQAFQAAGYIREAIVPGFFKGETGGLFIAKFFSPGRKKAEAALEAYPSTALSPQNPTVDIPGVNVVACTPGDADIMAAIYDQTFESYAFPIHQPDFIRRTMRENTIYYQARIKGKTAALAAAEIDAASQACEMTDFATLPEYRGMGLASLLLRRLDESAARREVITAFTIARADSADMNRVFAKRGYIYAGLLVKNTQIGGRIRSMNVWYKHL